MFLFYRAEMLRETTTLLQLILGPLPEVRNCPNPDFVHQIESAPRTTIFGFLSEGDLGYMRRTSYRPGLPPLVVRSTVPLPLLPVEEYTNRFVQNHYRRLRCDPTFSVVFPLVPAVDPHVAAVSENTSALLQRPAPGANLAFPAPDLGADGLPPGPSGSAFGKRPRQDEA